MPAAPLSAGTESRADGTICVAGNQVPETTPLKAALLQTLPQFQGDHAEELLWGSYRSGLYLGAELGLLTALCNAHTKAGHVQEAAARCR